MKAGYFVWVSKDLKVTVSKEYEMMEEFICRHKVPDKDRTWGVNFFEFQDKKTADMFAREARSDIIFAEEFNRILKI